MDYNQFEAEESLQRIIEMFGFGIFRPLGSGSQSQYSIQKSSQGDVVAEIPKLTVGLMQQRQSKIF